jgi:hypothetical protein
MYFFIISILSLLFFFEFKFKDKYLFRILITFVTGLIFFVLLGFNSFSPDLELYQLHYEDLDQDYIKLSVEPFVYYLMTLFKNSGFSFEGYQLFFSFLVFSLFIHSIFKYSQLPVFVCLNFFFIPFFPDITQIRFFLGFAFFLFSLQFFHSKKLLFYFLLLIAILCHFSLLVVVIFLIIRKFHFFKSQIKSNIIIIIGVCVLLLVPKQLIEPLIILLNPKYLFYLENEEIAGTFIGTLVLFIPFFIVNNIILWHYNTKYDEEVIPIKYAKNIPLFIELIQFSNFMILLQYFIRDFSRISQNMLIIATIYFSVIICTLIGEKKMLAARVIAVGVLVSTIIIFYIQFLMINNFKYFEVIDKTFTSNYLFDSIVKFFNIWG